MEDLLAEFQANTDQILAWTDRLSDAELRQRPLAGKWSPLEVLEHVFISEKGAARLIQAPATPIVRDLAKSRERMGRPLSKLDEKYVGGPAIDPKGRFEDYAQWRAAFLQNRATMAEAALALGGDGLCTGFPHPYFGQLTRAEWIAFAILHAERHLAQMQLQAQ